LDSDAVREVANDLLVQAAYDAVVGAGYPPETAVAVVQTGRAGEILSAVHGHDQADIAREVLAMAAEHLHNESHSPRDERGVAQKHLAMQQGSQVAQSRGSRPPGELPGWARDLINRA
jgi:ethanolamine utilization microcompartment shell protein EutL